MKSGDSVKRGYQSERSVALAAVSEAAGLCKQIQQELVAGVLEKSDRSPVTVADFGSQALICRRLKQQFPDDPIIAEEDSRVLRKTENRGIREQLVQQVRRFVTGVSEEQLLCWIDHGHHSDFCARFWTLDPIDGTRGFLRGEQYAISLALIVDGEIQVAALACPNLPSLHDDSQGVVFLAVRHHGVMEYPLQNPDEGIPIHTSDTRDIRLARFCESVESGHSSHADSATAARLLNIQTRPLRLDSQAKYGVVARGEADLYLRLPTSAEYREKIWDHAGGWLVVFEAEGMVTDIHGRPLDFTCGRQLLRNRGVVVSNGHVHEQVLSVLKTMNL